jgi:hypothetical protein
MELTSVVGLKRAIRILMSCKNDRDVTGDALKRAPTKAHLGIGENFWEGICAFEWRY